MTYNFKSPYPLAKGELRQKVFYSELVEFNRSR